MGFKAVGLIDLAGALRRGRHKNHGKYSLISLDERDLDGDMEKK
jgi:hypothetical protein